MKKIAATTVLRNAAIVAACAWTLSACTTTATSTQAPAAAVPQGSIKGTAKAHTPESLQQVVQQAWVSLPASVTGGAPYHGPYSQAPAAKAKAPVVVFVHGSSGVAPAIKEWQKWAAESLGIASIAPDSMQLKDRMTYKSPIAKADYEIVHKLRSDELTATMTALPQLPFADSSRVVIAGTSEGAVAVARYTPAPGIAREKGRLILSWTCEDNYHVLQHRTHLPNDLPVLNIVSSTDVYFSKANSWLGNPAPVGHCGEVLKDNKLSSVVLLPGAPHTLFNLPQARQPIEGFLRAQLK